jgi:hypothetical protein
LNRTPSERLWIVESGVDCSSYEYGRLRSEKAGRCSAGTQSSGRQLGGLPALSDADFEGLAICPESTDEGLIAGIFVTSGPQDHFAKDGREVNSLLRERVNLLAGVGRIGMDFEDAVRLEALEAISKDVRSDTFVGGEKFLEGTKAADHHVANDQKRPAITKHFDGSVEGTPGAPA